MIEVLLIEMRKGSVVAWPMSVGFGLAWSDGCDHANNKMQCRFFHPPKPLKSPPSCSSSCDLCLHKYFTDHGDGGCSRDLANLMWPP